MKQLIMLGTIALLITSCKPKDLPTVIKVTKQELQLKASHMTTEEQLKKIQVLAKQLHGLEVDYSKSSFLEVGTLKKLETTISKDGQLLGRVSADLSSLQLKYYGFSMTLAGDTVTHLKAGGF